jgi:hypothetical protein
LSLAPAPAATACSQSMPPPRNDAIRPGRRNRVQDWPCGAEHGTVRKVQRGRRGAIRPPLRPAAEHLRYRQAGCTAHAPHLHLSHFTMPLVAACWRGRAFAPIEATAQRRN